MRTIALVYLEMCAWLDLAIVILSGGANRTMIKNCWTNRHDMRKTIRLGYDNRDKSEEEMEMIFNAEFPSEKWNED